MFRRDVQNLSDVLNRCLRQNGLETPLLQHRLVNAWDEVVGKGIAAYTSDKFIKNQQSGSPCRPVYDEDGISQTAE